MTWSVLFLLYCSNFASDYNFELIKEQDVSISIYTKIYLFIVTVNVVVWQQEMAIPSPDMLHEVK